MICTTVRQRQYKTYHQCCGLSSTIVHHHNRYLQHYGSLDVQPIVGTLQYQHTSRHMMTTTTDQQ
eukprot:4547322-Prorocentrum_lima.AAC.1